MEYRRWGECLPRAAIGRLDAVYGTADHLWLLLGRLADFNARDQRRKKKAVDANGGQWTLPASRGVEPQGYMNGGSTRKDGQRSGTGKESATGIRGRHYAGMGDSTLNSAKEQHQSGKAAERPTRKHGTNSNIMALGHTSPHHETSEPNSARMSGTPFGGMPGGSLSGGRGFAGLPPDPLNGMHGMIPPTPAARMPEGFVNEPFSLASSEDDDLELEAATIEAEKEWEDIKRALGVFEDSLGPDYK